MTRLGDDWTEVDDVDIWTLDHLLDGSLPPDEIPPGYEEIASLVAAIKDGVAPAESGWGSQTVPAMVGILTAGPPRQWDRRRPARTAVSARRLRCLPHLAAAITVVAALGAGTAAAETGALPAPVQSALHTAAAQVGVRVPSAPAHASDSPPVGTSGVNGAAGVSRAWHPVGTVGRVSSSGGKAGWSGSLSEGSSASAAGAPADQGASGSGTSGTGPAPGSTGIPKSGGTSPIPPNDSSGGSGAPAPSGGPSTSPPIPASPTTIPTDSNPNGEGKGNGWGSGGTPPSTSHSNQSSNAAQSIGPPSP